jgi:hypothetical protein
VKKVSFALSLLIAVIATMLILGNKHISTEIAIDAPAEAVWAELTDFGKYPEWNPFIVKVTGDAVRGGTLEVTFHTKGSDPVAFSPTVLQNEKSSIFQWEGRLLMPGIFTGRHTFQLVRIDAVKTLLVQKEDFNGILVPFFSFKTTVDGFTLMNRELKKRVETRSRP